MKEKDHLWSLNINALFRSIIQDCNVKPEALQESQDVSGTESFPSHGPALEAMLERNNLVGQHQREAHEWMSK